MSDDLPDPDDGNRDDSPEDTADDTDPDPFADAVADRTGDPFEGLGAPRDETEGSADGRGDDTHEPQPEAAGSGDDGPTDDASAWRSLSEVSTSAPREASEGDTAPDASGGRVSPGSGEGEGAEDPFDGPDPRGDPFEDDVFQQRGAGDIDPDEAWADLATSEEAGDESERRYAEVSKHSYCENCEWFSEPPAVSCTHEGTEIVEFLDMETVRLLNCPVVEERRAIRDED